MNDIYNKDLRVEVSKEFYHANKKKYKRGEEIVAIPQFVGVGYNGYRYYILKSFIQ